MFKTIKEFMTFLLFFQFKDATDKAIKTSKDNRARGVVIAATALLLGMTINTNAISQVEVKDAPLISQPKSTESAPKEDINTELLNKLSALESRLNTLESANADLADVVLTKEAENQELVVKLSDSRDEIRSIKEKYETEIKHLEFKLKENKSKVKKVVKTDSIFDELLEI